MSGVHYRIDPGATRQAVGLLRTAEPFPPGWPDASAALDDPVVAAVAGLGAEVRRAADDAWAAVEDLASGAEAAVETYRRTDAAVAGGLAAVTDDARGAFGPGRARAVD